MARVDGKTVQRLTEAFAKSGRLDDLRAIRHHLEQCNCPEEVIQDIENMAWNLYMERQTMKNIPSSSPAAWTFGLLGFLFMAVAYFATPATSAIHPIPRLIGALLMAAFGFFVTGALGVDAAGRLGPFAKTSVKATAGFALFVLVWFGWPAMKAPAVGTSPVAGVAPAIASPSPAP